MTAVKKWRKQPAGPNKLAAQDWQKRLMEAFEASGMSGRRAAEKAGIGDSTFRHVIGKSSTVELDTLVKIADALGTRIEWIVAGTHSVLDATQSDAPKSILVAPLWQAGELGVLATPAAEGYIGIRAKEYPKDTQGVVVGDQAMVPEGQNAQPPLDSIVVPGDVVLWAKSVAPVPGQLVVATSVRGALIRRYSVNDKGEIVLLSNHHLYPRVVVKPQQIAGGVLAVERRVGR